MKQLKYIIELKEGFAWPNYERIFEIFKDGFIELVIRRVQVKKTREQLGYLYAEVLPKFYEFMMDSGYSCSEELMKEQIKMHPEIDYTENFISIFTGEVQKRGKSFSYATKEEMSDIIDKLIRLACDYGISIDSPDEYKNRLINKKIL